MKHIWIQHKHVSFPDTHFGVNVLAETLKCKGNLPGKIFQDDHLQFDLQETQVPIVHIIGAIVLFAFGNVYLWIQVAISFHMRNYGLITLCVCLTRLAMAVLTSVTFIVSTVTVSYASTKWNGDFLYWKAENPGHTPHVIGNVSEWLMVFSFLIATLSFTKELGKGGIQISFVTKQAS